MEGATAGRKPLALSLIAFVALAVVAVLASAFLYGRDRVDGSGTAAGDYTPGRPHGAADPGHARGEYTGPLEPVLRASDTELFAYLETNSSLIPFVGTEVTGENLPVLRQVSDTLFWVGRDTADPVLIAIDPTTANTEVRDVLSGDFVDPDENTLVQIVGVIRAVPESTDDLELSDEDREILDEQGAYVYATVFNLDT